MAFAAEQGAHALVESSCIVGVVIKPLISHTDDRGFFREIVRVTDPLFNRGAFGQWSHSVMVRNVVKAWHYHHIQTDWWYVPIGCVEAVLFDNRPESPSYKQKVVVYMGEGVADNGSLPSPVCIRIPPGVLHGCRVHSESAHLLYITSHTYDPNEEGRLPFDSPLVGHDWGPNPLTVANDRRTFEPKSIRSPIDASTVD